MTTQSDHAADARVGHRAGRVRALALGLIGLALAAPLGARAAANALFDRALSDARHGNAPAEARGWIATAVRWGADPNRRSQYGPSALLIACQQGDSDLARLLLHRGASPDGGAPFAAAPGTFGWRSPLAMALAAGHYDIASLLLASGADVGQDVQRTPTPGFFFIGTVRSLLRDGRIDLVNALWRRGLPSSVILEDAVAFGDTSFIGKFLAAFPAGQKRAAAMQEALVAAAGQCRPGLVRFLLAKGARSGAPDAGGTFPILATVGRLAPPPSVGTEGGARKGDEAGEQALSVLRLLLDAGADANARTEQGFTALMVAAGSGRPSLVQILLARGADVNTRQLPRVPDIGASETGERSSPLPPESAEGSTALSVAARTRDIAMVRLLLARGAKINLRPRAGWTPLMQAAANNDRAIAAILLDAGADVNEGDRHGTTALMVAARNNRQEMADLLLARGADPRRKKEDGSDAAALALTSGFPDLAAHLRTARSTPASVR